MPQFEWYRGYLFLLVSGRFLLGAFFIFEPIAGSAEGGKPLAGTMFAHRTRRNAGDGIPYGLYGKLYL